MIRFECETCGRGLRAPLALAGKRGRCSHCGTANRVPAQAGLAPRRAAAMPASPVNVEVKRATGASPFRTTADVALAPAAGTFVAGEADSTRVLGTGGGVAVLADPPQLTDQRGGGGGEDFLGALSKRLGGTEEGDAGGELLAELEAAPMPRPRRRAAEGVRLGALPMRHASDQPVTREAERVNVRGVLFGVLMVGIAIGFLAGLMAARAFW